MTKQDLENLRWLDERINLTLEHIAYLKSKAYPGAIRYDDIGGSKPMVFDSLGDLYAEIDLEERRVDKLIDQYTTLRTRAITTIRKLPTRRERNILYLRYIAYLSWEDVEEIINIRDHCSRRTLFAIHNRALQKMT